MFSIDRIKAAKQRINGEFKAFLTSDNSLYVLKRNEDMGSLLKHCSDNGLTLFDVEDNKEIEIKIKKTKTNGSADS